MRFRLSERHTYLVTIGALSFICGVLLFENIRDWAVDHFPMAGNVIIEPGAPKAEEIRRIIAPLKYSGVAHFMDPKVALAIDFQRQNWVLRNVHEFDQDGRVVLKEGRFGLCGDLGAYTYDRVRKILDPARYEMSFLRVAESSYFKGEQGTHIVLLIIDRLAKPEPELYILDPSLRKYGKPDLFATYWPLTPLQELDFVRDRDPDQAFVLTAGPPIHMNDRAMLSLYVLPYEGKFDRENYVVQLALLKRYEYLTRPLLSYVVKNGVAEWVEDKYPAERLFSRGLYSELRARVIELVRNIRFEDIRFEPSETAAPNTALSSLQINASIFSDSGGLQRALNK